MLSKYQLKAPGPLPFSPTSAFALQEPSAIHLPGSTSRSGSASPYNSPPTSPNFASSFSDIQSQSGVGRTPPPKSPLFAPGTPRAVHSEADGIPSAHALPSPSTDAFPAAIGGGLFPTSYTPSGPSSLIGLGPTGAQGYLQSASSSAVALGIYNPTPTPPRPAAGFARTNSSPVISTRISAHPTRSSPLRSKTNNDSAVISPIISSAHTKPTGGLAGSWMTDTAYGTTPRFSRLSLAASGVTLPLTPKEHKRKSMSRASSKSSLAIMMSPTSIPSKASGVFQQSTRPRPDSRASSFTSIDSAVSDYGREFMYEVSAHGHGQEEGRRSSSSFGHVRHSSSPPPPLPLGGQKTRQFAGSLDGRGGNHSVPSLSLSHTGSDASDSDDLITPPHSNTTFHRVNSLSEFHENAGDVGKQMTQPATHSRQSSSSKSKSKSGWLGSFRGGKGDTKEMSFMSFDSNESAPSPIVGPMLVIPPIPANEIPHIPSIKPHTVKQGSGGSSGGGIMPEKHAGTVRRLWRTLSTVGKKH